MTLRHTPAAIIAIYEYLRATAPFNKWGLPESDDLEFRVTSDAKRYGHFEVSTDPKKPYPVIGISAVNTKTSHGLMETIAHEAVHLKRFMESGPRALNHGPKFKALAKLVCRVHGFDHKTF